MYCWSCIVHSCFVQRSGELQVGLNPSLHCGGAFGLLFLKLGLQATLPAARLAELLVSAVFATSKNIAACSRPWHPR